jgi:hypothetical protein
MSFGVLFELPFFLDGILNLFARHYILFDQAVRNNGRGSSIEKIQHSIIHVSQPDPKFVNAIPQKVGLGPP